MKYPEIYLPKEIIENLSKIFPLPVKPIKPNLPIEPKKSQTFFGFIAGIILACIFFFIQVPIIALILLGASIYSLFSNTEKEKYKDDISKYNSAVIKYNRDLEEYEKDIQITDSHNYQEHKRNQAIESILKKSTKHSENIDYKKGVSHNYFKAYLIEHFKDSIFESVSIQVKNYPTYYENESNIYITDFAYIDKYINLKIDIEIDEPYTFEKKQAIHLNDQKRNDFFLQNNWIVIRFAEEQVINHPELCCEFIAKVINCFYYDHLSLIKFDSKLPKVPKWNSESVKKLIDADYRNSYLNGKIYFRL